MKRSMHMCGVIALAMLSWLAPSAYGEDERLTRAQDLFAQRDYAGAQVILLEIERDALEAEDQQIYDDLLVRIPDAIAGVSRAAEDLQAADEAYDAGQWREAQRLYSAVLDNPFADAQQQMRAGERREMVAEKLALADAANAAGEPIVTPAAEAPLPEPRVRQSEPRRVTPIDELRRRDELLWQRAVARMNDVIRRAQTAAAANNFIEARRHLLSARQLVEQAKVYAQPASRYQTALDTVTTAEQQITSAEEQYERAQAREQRERIAEQVEQSRIRQENARREHVERLFNQAAQLQKERRFSDAADIMRQILAIEPGNDRAQYWLSLYEDMHSLDMQVEIKRAKDRETQRMLTQTDDALIPWTQDILYPTNWPEISRRRDRLTQGVASLDEDFELNRRLDLVEQDVSFDETPFEQAIGFVKDMNDDLNFSIDWADLEASGVRRDRPVSLQFSDVRLRVIIEEMLKQVGGDIELGAQVADGIISIATRSKLNRNKTTLVYDIRDLLVDIPNFTSAPQTSLRRGVAEVVNTGSVFSDRGSPGDLGEPTRQFASNNRIKAEEIMDIIRSTVEPDSWRATGGGEAAMRELNGQLIVYNTSEAHQQAQALLDQLREARALMIAVETRFLTVTSNFLEEIGVDLDFVFNAGDAGFDPIFNAQGAPVTDPFTGGLVLMPRQYSRSGIIPAVPPVATPLPQLTPGQPFQNAAFVPQGAGVIPSSSYMTPIPVQSNSLGIVDPRSVNTGIPGSFAGNQGLDAALNLAGSFLDNLQVDFLIRATQANRRSSIVQAPRLMLFNGQRAFIAVDRTRQYVSTVTPSVAEGAVGVQPQTAAAVSGTSLDVQGTISADRKYVTMTIRTGVSGEPQFETFEVQRASGNSPGIFITLTDQERQQIRTTVSIPDGGTVLIGGLKQVGEVEIEAGVPILSKIPILKRAFTNTSLVKDTQTLLILMKTKILIQSEAEQDAFPTLSSR